VCVSAKCNAQTKTCARDDGASCSAANECVQDQCTSGHCGACYLDADCPASSYCDRSQYKCQPDRDDGQSIPGNDGYHSGTCSDAAAVCVSGKCNETANSCAAETNRACALALQCTSNVCDPNGKCGVADGGSCLPSNGTTLCQSATCAPSGRCVPANGDGCYADSDCDSSEYCDRASLQCTPKLIDGIPIPRDGLHDGRCTQPNAQAVCRSAGCNAVSNTCASNNGASCTVPEQCVRNICGTNEQCGHADGAGPCTPSDGKFVCQSGACSSTGMVCVPAISRSCASDSDCAPDAYCDGRTSSCAPDLPDGQAIPSDGLHDGLCSTQNARAVCTSRGCNAATNQCAAPLGAACATAAQCAANVCGQNGKCGLANGTGPCRASDAQTQCQSATCSQDGTCIANGRCNVDADCLPDRFCDRSVRQCHARLPAGTAVPSDGYHDGRCPADGVTPVCASGSCSSATDRCVLANGADCNSESECGSGACGTNQQCGLAPEAAGCSPGADPRCQSGVCEADGTCAYGASCSSDSECAANGGFCSAGSCQPRLPLGAAIPDDALHHASCTEPIAAAVCESSRCNASTATCAAAPSNACGVPAQCQSNVCEGNGRCGLPDGSGPCTSSDAAAVCQSQDCSVSGVCIAAGGCASDAECSSDTYCDGATFRCVSTLSSGTRVPNDSLHSGLCSEANARACTSGACNAALHTCARPNSESCAGPADCASNVCASDGKCGWPNGEGQCSVSEADSCRSGACSPSSLACIPANGCGSSNDCARSDYCDLSTYTCKPRRPDGEQLPSGDSCPTSGVTRDCASGLCRSDSVRCVGPLGVSCSDATQCQAGVCGQNSLCGIEPSGACSQSEPGLCQSQQCGSNEQCSAAASCNSDAQCLPGGYCDGLFCQPKLRSGSSIPADLLHDGKCTRDNARAACISAACNDTSDTCAGANYEACADGTACVSGACAADQRCGFDIAEGPCTSQEALSVCRSGLCSVVGVCLPSQQSGCAIDSDCRSDSYCDLNQYECVPKQTDGEPLAIDGLHDGKCSLRNAAVLCTSGACNPVTNSCARANGVACTSARTCVSNVCGSNGLCGVADGDGRCGADTTYVCQSYRCSTGPGVCIRAGDGCAQDADCNSSSFCDPVAHSCKPKLPLGAALPKETLHNGLCSNMLGAQVCQSAQCNRTTNTCAGINGTRCDGADKCTSNLCGDNGRCGLAIGQSGCTSQNQGQTCQSSYCSASGVCVPPQGCNVDSDCSGGTYCNRSARVCDPLLREGRTLPRDDLHDGKCSAELASAVCASSACNRVTDTCAAANNRSCTGASQCATNVCGSNNRCGLKDGAGPCDDDAQCQSGRCQSESGRCVARSNGCTRDEDCPREAYCNTAALRCEPDVPDGLPLPPDTPSGGKCTEEVAKLCASGACNATTDSCAAAGGNSCSRNADCASNQCLDGQCGSPDGAGRCTQENAASACQSGVCQAELSRCVAAKNGCSVDGDCPEGSYCDGHTLACVPQLAAGFALPSDETHAAICSAELATIVCSTRACNAHTNLCALVVGTQCEQASDCASNACLLGECVPDNEAPPAARLTGGRCSIAWVQAGSIGPTLALLWLALFALRRRKSP
jgi:hypothetical protein